ncbi:hypothetical protein KEM56_006200, partial [Ascosphaera pollenicola]
NTTPADFLDAETATYQYHDHHGRHEFAHAQLNVSRAPYAAHAVSALSCIERVTRAEVDILLCLVDTQHAAAQTFALESLVHILEQRRHDFPADLRLKEEPPLPASFYKSTAHHT